MSVDVGVASSSKTMGFDDSEDEIKKTGSDVEPGTGSVYAATEDEEEEDDDTESKIQLGPQITLKELSEKDKVFSSFVA